MRICFDRLCFASKRPAGEEDQLPQLQGITTTTTSLNINNNNNNRNNISTLPFDGASINSLDPPRYQRDYTKRIDSILTESINNKVAPIEHHLSHTNTNNCTSNHYGKVNSEKRKEFLQNNAKDDKKAEIKMQQEPNANIPLQPELVMVSNPPPDVLQQNVIYGSASVSDPNVDSQTINYLQQQQHQLQQRIQQHLQSQLQQQLAPPAQPLFHPPLPQAVTIQQPLTILQQPIIPFNDLNKSGLGLPDQMQNLCLAEEPNMNNIVMNSIAPMNTQEQQYLQIIQARDIKIQELQTFLRQKENEIAELKSHLDKFQSVFPFSRSRKPDNAFPRQRAQGISAEPQSESSVLELLHHTFPKYDKDER